MAAARHQHPGSHKLPRARQTVTCVCLLVRLEDPGRDKAASTELALVGLLPGVGPHVLLQVAGLLKAFVAVLTPTNTARRANAPSVHSTSTSVTSEAGGGTVSPMITEQSGMTVTHTGVCSNVEEMTK